MKTAIFFNALFIIFQINKEVFFIVMNFTIIIKLWTEKQQSKLNIVSSEEIDNDRGVTLETTLGPVFVLYIDDILGSCFIVGGYMIEVDKKY